MSLRSWVRNFPIASFAKGFSQEFAVRLIKAGPVPRHIAFIMDGNRRFAKANGLELGEGHVAGFESLSTVLEVCYSVGVHTVTVYAFSIENFNRPQHEIDSLFNIIRSKLVVIGEKDDVPARYGIAVKFVGNRDLIPEDILVLIENLENLTKNNTRGVLSIAFPYTSRDDMAHAMQQLTTNVQAHTLDPKDIDMPKFESELYTGPDPDLDIMVRTSGETRFSDFMIWESCDNCSVEYISTLWPAMAPFDMFKILFKYSYKITKNYGTQANLQRIRDNIKVSPTYQTPSFKEKV